MNCCPLCYAELSKDGPYSAFSTHPLALLCGMSELTAHDASWMVMGGQVNNIRQDARADSLTVLVDAAVVNWTPPNKDDSRKMLDDLLACVAREALDPAISEAAAKLVADAKREALEATTKQREVADELMLAAVVYLGGATMIDNILLHQEKYRQPIIDLAAAITAYEIFVKQRGILPTRPVVPADDELVAPI